MSEIIDTTNELVDHYTSVAIANRPRPAPLSPICLNGDCGEPSVPGTSYCCAECCTDHQKHIRAERQSGRM